MAGIVKIPTFTDERGSLSVIEKELPFSVKRTFYIYNVPNKKIIRGKHRHKKTIQALICLAGSCEVFNNNGKETTTYKLDSPDQCLLLMPEDWHYMNSFSSDAVLLVLASENYDKDDYIYEAYE